MDKHALEVIQHETFLQLSPSALNELIARNSFYAPEIDVFLAVQAWVKANPDVEAKDVVGKKLRIQFMHRRLLQNINDYFLS